MVGGAYTHDNTNPPTSDRGLQLFSCKGKTAIVSGAGAGIGLAVAQVLAEFGANVAIWFNKNQSALDRATEIEKEYGVRCKSRKAEHRKEILKTDPGKAYKVDVTSAEQVQASVDAVVQDLNGRLDIFVAAAGMFPEAGPILDLDIDNYRGAMAGNLDSTFYCARATGKHWRRQKREGTDANGQKLENFTYGTFVATASLAGGHIVEVPDLAAAYSIAKAGVIQLCQWDPVPSRVCLQLCR